MRNHQPLIGDIFHVVTISLVVSCATIASAAPQTTAGRVTDVTLYRNQALVTRNVDVKGAMGSVEVVVTDLPENISSDSLFAEGGDTVEVRAVRYRSRAVGEEPREEVRQLDELRLAN